MCVLTEKYIVEKSGVETFLKADNLFGSPIRRRAETGSGSCTASVARC
jgi:hypothetical protein